MPHLILISLLFLLICACSDSSSGSSSHEEDPNADTLHVGMIAIPAKSKSTTLGANAAESSSKAPAMTVTFDYNFSIGKHEVTRKEYAEWTGKDIENPDSLPMTNITYYDAILAANARSKKENLDTAYSYSKATFVDGNCTSIEALSFSPSSKGYRLPTEAEWVYAAEFGGFTPDGSWNSKNSNDSLHPVCTTESSTTLCDMAGNAMEWVNDWLGNFKDTTIANYIGSPNGGALGERILKGGSYQNKPENMKVYSRGDVYTVTSSTKTNYVGFRLAVGAIPNAQYFNSEGTTNSTIIPVASAQALKSKIGTTHARLAFRDDDLGKIIVIEYACGNNAVFEPKKRGEPYHLTISPNGQWIAYSTQPEGISGFDTLYIQAFNAADTTYFRYKKVSAAEPRWHVTNYTDTSLIFGTSGGNNESDGTFFQEKTYELQFNKKEFGSLTQLFDGSYHGGLSYDKNFAVTGSKLLRVYSDDSDTIWYNGEQACNASLSKDSSKRTLFLDFGSETGRKFADENYSAHERILIADSLGKLIQAIPSPDGYAFDHTEWTSNPNLILATLTDSEGRHSKIVLVDIRDSSVLTLVEGNELWHPALWIEQGRNMFPVDTTLSIDSLGVYMLETSNLASRILKVKMDLFWTTRSYAEVIITGSSRSFSGIDPTLISAGYAVNHSYSAQDMAGTEFFISHYYLPHEPKIKTIAIALDIDRWIFTDEDFLELYHSVPGYLYDAHHDFWRDGVPAFMRKYVVDNISPDPNEYGTYAYNRGLYKSHSTGYSENPEVNFSKYNKTSAEYNIQKLLEIIDVARTYGVNVVGIVFPQNPLYISKENIWGRYGPSLSDAKMLLNTLDSIAKVKDNFYILDEYKNGKNDYESEDFANDDHLGLSGAKKLTVRLDSLLLKIQ